MSKLSYSYLFELFRQSTYISLLLYIIKLLNSFLKNKLILFNFPYMKMRFLKILIIILLPIFLTAQQGGNGNGRTQRQGNQGERPKLKLTGIVKDQETSRGLEFATISVFSLKDSSLVGGGLSGLDGIYEIEVPMGRLFAEIEFIGYEKTIISSIEFDRDAIRAGNMTVTLDDIFLRSSSLSIDEVVIQGEKSTNQFSLDKRVFNVGSDLANRGGTAEDLLDNVPSVTVDIDGTVSLRGSTGVRILINGQPSRLASGTNGLKNISSDMIESVEVITNPSARYEAEGMAGIINIILKKEKRSGFNGSFNSSVSFPLGAGLGANLNYRKNKINWFANYNINYRSSPGNGYINQEITSDSLLLISEQSRDMLRNGMSNNLRGGIEYFISEKQSITGSVQYSLSTNDNLTTLIYDDFLNNKDYKINSTTRIDTENGDENQLQFNVDYYQEFTDRNHTLKASFQYEDAIENQGSNFVETNIQSTSQLLQRSLNEEGQGNFSFNADYQQPLGSKDHKYELGIRTSLRTIENDYLVEQNDAGIWNSLAQFSNDFNYTENISAAYAQYGNKIGKFGFQVGLRAEYAIISTELVNDNILNQRDTFNFFPSVFLNYEISEGNAIQTSYSRRVRRPGFRDLNPFFSYSDNRNFYSGNPFLNPEFTNSYEINYIKIWDQATLSSGIFYRQTADVISRIRRLTDDNNFITQPENLGFQDDFGVEFNATYNPATWARLSGNVNFFRSITTSGTTDINLDADTYALTGRLMTKFTVWKGSDIQLTGNFRSPRLTPQGRTRAINSMDFGWSKDFLKKKNLSLTLSVRDVFNSRKRNFETFGENFYSEGEFQWRVRTISLSAIYRINQNKQRSRGGGGGDDGGGFEGGDF